MPEIIECQKLRENIESSLKGFSFGGFSLIGDSGYVPMVKGTLKQWNKFLIGRKVEGTGRVGKYIVVKMTGNVEWLIHLSSTGWLMPEDGQGVWVRNFVHSTGPATYRLRLNFNREGLEYNWIYSDARTFGKWYLAVGLGTRSMFRVLRKMGPDWLDDQIAAEKKLIVSVSSAPMLRVFLDQSNTAGLGLYLTVEAAFRASIHPMVKWGSLTRRRKILVVSKIPELLKDVSDGVGWRVFRRKGMPCCNCGSEIKRESVFGRGVYYCSECQVRY